MNASVHKLIEIRTILNLAGCLTMSTALGAQVTPTNPANPPFDPVQREHQAPDSLKRLLQALRDTIKAKGLHFTVGYTGVSELPLSKITGLKVPRDLPKRIKDQHKKASRYEAEERLASSAAAVATEASCAASRHYDWRAHFNWSIDPQTNSPVRNQRSCGSCWDFAAMAAYEGAFGRIATEGIDVAEQQILDCWTLAGDCSGGFYVNVFSYLENYEKNASEAVYPYKARVGKCLEKTARVYTADTWDYVPPRGYSPFGAMASLVPSVAEIKSALCKRGPIAVSVNATEAFHHYNGGVFDELRLGSVNHAVAIVGWDDGPATVLGHGVWIIKNSWGPNWGETGGYGTDSGYMQIAYESNLIGYGGAWVRPNTGLYIRSKRSVGDGSWTNWSQRLGDGKGVHKYPTLVGDVDGDGRSDLIFVGQDWSATNSNLDVRVKRANGDGTWTSWSQALGDGAGVHKYPALIGFVDHDRMSDVIFVGQDWSGAGLNIRVKRSNGDGTWKSWGQVLGDGAGVHTYPTLIGDVDGDGLSDLIFVGQNWSGAGLNIRVKRSNGDGTWSSWSQVLGDGAGIHRYPTLVGDVDGDGKSDLIFVGQNWSGPGLNIRVKRSNGDGTWASWSQVVGDGAAVHNYSTLLGDVDHDGRSDLIFVGQNWSGAGLNIRVKRSNGDGTWTSWNQILGDGAGVHKYPTLVADVDNDQRADLIFVGQDWTSSNSNLEIRVKRSNGNGTWTSWSQVLGDGAGVHKYPTLVGDIDHDGRLDLIFLGQNWGL